MAARDSSRFGAKHPYMADAFDALSYRDALLTVCFAALVALAVWLGRYDRSPLYEPWDWTLLSTAQPFSVGSFLWPTVFAAAVYVAGAFLWHLARAPHRILQAERDAQKTPDSAPAAPLTVEVQLNDEDINRRLRETAAAHAAENAFKYRVEHPQRMRELEEGTMAGRGWVRMAISADNEWRTAPEGLRPGPKAQRAGETMLRVNKIWYPAYAALLRELFPEHPEATITAYRIDHHHLPSMNAYNELLDRVAALTAAHRAAQAEQTTT